MPTCLVIDKCESESLFRMIQPPAGHTLETFRKAGGKLASLVPFAVAMGGAIRAENVARVYEYGGASRVMLPDDKLILPIEEAQFLMTRYPGLIEVIDDSDGSDATVAVLLRQRETLEQKIRELQAELDTAKRVAASAKVATQAAESRAASLAVEREEAISIRARLEKELGDTKNAIQELRATDAGAAKLENQHLKAEVEDLKKDLAKAKSKR